MKRTAALAASVVAALSMVTVPPPSVRAQGGSTISSIGGILGWVESAIDEFEPSKETGRTVSDPYVSPNGRYNIVAASQQDTLTIIIEVTERYSVPGATPGSAAYEVTDTGGTTLQVDTCPDDGGTVTISAHASGTYDVVGDELGYHATLDTHDEATVTVGTDAEISGRDHILTVRGSATGDRPAFLGGEGVGDSQLDASLAWSGALSDAAPEVSVTTAEGVDARDLRSAFTSGAFTAALVDAAIDAAARVWKDGRCLELVVEPPGKEVDPGSETEITVKIEHKAFEDEIKRDIRATALEGTEKVEPFDQPVPAEATFTYTATSESQGEGTITFRTVSNRGIAERTETYTVSQRLLLDAEGSLTMEAGGMTYRMEYRGSGLKVVLVPGETPDAPPRVSVEGELALRGRIRGLLGKFNCTGNFRTSAPVDAAADVSAQIFGEGEDRRLSVHLTPRDSTGTIDFPMRCRFPTGPTTVPHNIPVGFAFPIWSGPGTAVELPLTGGTASHRQSVGSARYDSSLTLRQEDQRPAP